MLVKLTTGVNFTNILHKAFTRSDPKSAKETDSLTLFFAQLGSARAKAALKMLVISTLDVAMGLLPWVSEVIAETGLNLILVRKWRWFLVQPQERSNPVVPATTSSDLSNVRVRIWTKDLLMCALEVEATSHVNVKRSRSEFSMTNRTFPKMRRSRLQSPTHHRSGLFPHFLHFWKKNIESL